MNRIPTGRLLPKVLLCCLILFSVWGSSPAPIARASMNDQLESLIHLYKIQEADPVGKDFIFLVDQSGSMGVVGAPDPGNDPVCRGHPGRSRAQLSGIGNPAAACLLGTNVE